MNQPHAVTRRGLSLSKKSCWTFSPSCYQNCKINFCSMILQFCRCGELWNAKGHPDGFLSHFSSLRNFWLGRFFDSLLYYPCGACGAKKPKLRIFIS